MLVPREGSVLHRSRIRHATRSAASSRHKGKPPGHLPKICTMHLPCAAQGATPRGFAQGRQRQHADPMQTGGTYHPEHIQGNPRLSQRCPLDAMPFEPEGCLPILRQGGGQASDILWITSAKATMAASQQFLLSTTRLRQ